MQDAKDAFGGLTLTQAILKINSGEITSSELVEFFLQKIEARNSNTNSFIRVTTKEAKKRAHLADNRVREGKSGNFPLNGAPIAVKDLFDMKGIPTTCGSAARRDYVPSRNSVVVQRLLEAGAVILGKLNMHEFAFGPTSENEAFGDVRNPWNVECFAGGSSGGSAASVADGLCLASIGTDTGGSIRIPASICGVVGMKPTAGCIDLTGVFPLSWTLDNAGPLARNVKDCALMLQVMLDPDKKERIDGTISTEKANRSVSKCKVAILENFPVPLEHTVYSNFEKGTKIIANITKKVEHFELPFLVHYKTIADLIMTCESCAIHETLLKNKFVNYGINVRPKILSGNFISVVEYLEALKIKKRLMNFLLESMKNFDLLILPTTPLVGHKIGDDLVSLGRRRVRVAYALGILTRPFSLCGFPAISVPCGFTSIKKGGLPVGLQIVGKPFHDNLVLAFAEAYEKERT